MHTVRPNQLALVIALFFLSTTTIDIALAEPKPITKSKAESQQITRPQKSRGTETRIKKANAVIPEMATAEELPATFSFQGLMTDGSGDPIEDGSHGVVFRLYTSSEGGSALWSEAQSLESNSGVIHARLGEAVPFEGLLDFTVPYFLTVEIDDGGESSPRIPLTSVPYAFTSKWAGLADSAGFAQYANRADSALFAEAAVSVDSARVAHRADIAGIAELADSSTISGWSLRSDSASYALNAGSVTTAQWAEASAHAYAADTASVAERACMAMSVCDTSGFTFANITVTGEITAGSFSGDGSGLTNLPQSSTNWEDLVGTPEGFADGVDSVNTNWADLTGIPSGFADGIDDTTSYLDWSHILNKPAELSDGDSVNTNWNDLQNVPEGFADGVDSVNTNWADLTGVPSGFWDGVDDTTSSLDWSQITNKPDGIENDSVNTNWDDLDNVPSGFADGVDDTVTTIQWSSLLNVPSGFWDGVDDTTSALDWSQITNKPDGLESDSVNTNWDDLDNVPEGFADGVDDTITTMEWDSLLNVPSGFADGIDDTGDGWSLSGNSGTTAGTDFIGTMDDEDLVFKVNDTQVMRLIPNTTSPNILGGYSGNSIISGAYGSTISGGGSSAGANITYDAYCTIGGGQGNVAGTNDGDVSSDYYAAVLSGFTNQSTGAFSSVTGGRENTATGDYSNVAGGYDNHATGLHSTVGGGLTNSSEADYAAVVGGNNIAALSAYSFAGGGKDNKTSTDAQYGVVCGGQKNTAGGNYSFIGGGYYNDTVEPFGVIVGGSNHVVRGQYCTILGGTGGWIWEDSEYSAILGGNSCQIEGSYSYVMGNHCTAYADYCTVLGNNAQATYGGSFVWADGSVSGNFYNTAYNSFNIRAAGGAYFYTDTEMSSGVTLAAGGSSWSSVSDRNKKENFAEIDGEALLNKIETMPVLTWNYKTQDDEIRHMGPMAQDFYAAFCLSDDSLRINTVDIDGVNLAAVQALIERNRQLETRVEALETSGTPYRTSSQISDENIRLRSRVERLEQMVEQLLNAEGGEIAPASGGASSRELSPVSYNREGGR